MINYLTYGDSISHHIAKLPKEFLRLLAELLVVARKSKRWRQSDLAERIGISRQSVARMERGDATVAIGHYVMAAWLLDIPILPGLKTESADLQTMIGQLVSFLAQQLPERIVKKQEKPIDDDF